MSILPLWFLVMVLRKAFPIIASKDFQRTAMHLLGQITKDAPVREPTKNNKMY